MLDTNVISDLLRNPDGSAAKRIADVGSDAICVSIITAAELRYGCAKKGSAKLAAHVEAILESVQILAFDMPADAEYGVIRAELETAGKTIGPNDLLIAAHACAAGAILVTDNTGEFSRVRRLRVENWVR
ncbi:MAG: type II toxin-antitoxin system VapC family toxin [Microgenomates group bacterium]|jgi:tRNA(fMet)-specific endonuclease VapC